MAINFSSGGSQDRPAMTRTSVINVSGSSTHDFTNIPSNVEKITVWFYEVGYSGSGIMQKIRLGDSGGIETTGYDGHTAYIGTGNNCLTYTDGIPLWTTNSDEHVTGQMTIERSPGTNIWCFSGCGKFEPAYTYVSGGRKSLSGTLTTVRLFNQGGTNFDQGQIWATYEN
jgi:hypothetical protein